MNEEKMREEFEAWAVSEGYARDCMVSGHYIYADTGAAWDAWQASRAAPAAQEEPVAYAVFADNGNIRIWCGDPNQVETLRQQYGEALQPLYTATLTTEQQPAPDVAELQAELERERKRRFDGNEQASREHREDMKSLVRALECALETMENVDGANDCSRGIDAAEEALAAYRKGGDA